MDLSSVPRGCQLDLTDCQVATAILSGRLTAACRSDTMRAFTGNPDET